MLAEHARTSSRGEDSREMKRINVLAAPLWGFPKKGIDREIDRPFLLNGGGNGRASLAPQRKVSICSSGR